MAPAVESRKRDIGAADRHAGDETADSARGAANHAPGHAGVAASTSDARRSGYMCPMCPGVWRAGPDACPKCGMALEPVAVSAAPAANPELAYMTRRLWASAVLTVPVLLLAMGEMVPVLASYVQGPWNPWMQLVLASPVVLWGGWPFFVRGWKSLGTRHFNMFTLIAIGTGAAYAYSIVAVVAPGLFPVGFRSANGQVGIYFEAAAVITALVLVGQVLELRAREQTNDAVRALLDLTPALACRLGHDGSEEVIASDQVAVGDRLRIRPGERIPVDGAVVEGRSPVDESMVTGEPVPVDKYAGQSLIGGTLNGSGSLVMRAGSVGRDTVLARIVQMVTEAQRSRAPIQRIADVVSGYFVPVVMAVSVLAFVAWSLWGPAPALAYGLIAAVSVLIIACPCALGLATPMSITVGMGRGAHAGVLIKHAAALERLERVDTLVVDKTGTLTEGQPRLVAVTVLASAATANAPATSGAAPVPPTPAGQLSENQLLGLVASLERASEHPLAAAVVAGAQERGIALVEATEFRAVPGQGVGGYVDGRQVVLGNRALMAAHGVDMTLLAATAEEQRRGGATVTYVAVDGHPAGLVAVADPIKDTTPAAVRALRAAGLRVVMLTGDNRTTALAVASQLGIDEVEADTQPEQKHAVVRRLQAAGQVVAMAGDGINDAPALAQADVGIAMGSGTDVAIESADVTLVKGDLNGIVRALHLSRATMRNIRQNLFFALVYNALGVPVAAGVLYPIAGVLLNPMLGAAAMSLSSVSVIANALRLRRALL